MKISMRIWMIAILAILAHPVNAQEEAPAGPGKDIVKKTSGEQILSANVTDETYETVTVNSKPIPTVEIESITHGDQPPKYVQAMSQFRQFQLENAIKSFEEAKAAQARPWLKHYCDYYIGQCYQKLGEGTANPQERAAVMGKAIAQYEKLIKETPKGLWVPNAMFSMGQCYFNLGDYPKALAAFQQMEKANMGPTWTLRAQLWSGKILTAQNQPDAAATALMKVSEAAKDKYPDIYTDAEVALAEALIVGKKFQEADELMKKLIESSEKEEVLALAHNTLGDSYRLQNKVKEARLEYLRTNILYFKAKEQDARALYWAAWCSEALKEKERADRMRDELKSKYPDSPWARALSASAAVAP